MQKLSVLQYVQVSSISFFFVPNVIDIAGILDTFYTPNNSKPITNSMLSKKRYEILISVGMKTWQHTFYWLNDTTLFRKKYNWIIVYLHRSKTGDI